MRTRRRAFAFHPESDKPAREAGVFLALKFFATGKIRLRQIDEKSEAGFERIVLRRKVGAVERIAHLETQGVARAEAAGANA